MSKEYADFKGSEQGKPSAPVEIDADQIALDCAASVMDLLEGSLPPSPTKWCQLKAAVQCRGIAALKRKQ